MNHTDIPEEPDAVEAPPLLRVVHGGEPSEEELAAIVAVVSARAAASETVEAPSLRPKLSAWVASGHVKGTRTKA